MGCTSSKTKSVEDLSGVGTKNQAPKNQPKNEKNGQAKNNSEQPILRETAKTTNAAAPSSSEAIQIPGAHRSFLAPDGIPFIDEDVDDDDDQTGGAGETVTSPRPDVNKNLAKEPVSEPAKPPVVVEVKSPQPPTVSVISEEERHPAIDEAAAAAPVAEHHAPEESTAKEPQPDTEKAWTDALDVLSKDLELDAAPASSTEHETVHISASVAADTAASAPDQAISEDQQAAAAVKIQAGIRGYRDRQKVKAIRAAKHVPSDELESSAHQPEVSADAPVVVVDVDQSAPDGTVEIKYTSDEVHHDVAVSNQEDESATTVVVEGELQEDSDDDPDKQRAAVKIQANYKGWKTRKEIGKVKP